MIKQRNERIRKQEHNLLDFWDRELDVVVGTILWLSLTLLSILPIAGVHSQLLFNRAYATAIGTLNRQSELISSLFATSLSSSYTRAYALSSCLHELYGAFCFVCQLLDGWKDDAVWPD